MKAGGQKLSPEQGSVLPRILVGSWDSGTWHSATGRLGPSASCQLL